MKNKDKYDLRNLQFLWMYNSYHGRCGIDILSGDEYIESITGIGYSPIPSIMEWLEKEEENEYSRSI